MNNLKQITFDDFAEHIGKELLIKTKDKEQTVKLVSVTDNSFSVKIKKNDAWDGIEPHYAKPTSESICKIYVYL
jgi:hypothetical protein